MRAEALHVDSVRVVLDAHLAALEVHLGLDDSGHAGERAVDTDRAPDASVQSLDCDHRDLGIDRCGLGQRGGQEQQDERQRAAPDAHPYPTGPRLDGATPSCR